jgi:hypothetical protein
MRVLTRAMSQPPGAGGGDQGRPPLHPTRVPPVPPYTQAGPVPSSVPSRIPIRLTANVAWRIFLLRMALHAGVLLSVGVMLAVARGVVRQLPAGMGAPDEIDWLVVLVVLMVAQFLHLLFVVSIARAALAPRTSARWTGVSASTAINVMTHMYSVPSTRLIFATMLLTSVVAIGAAGAQVSLMGGHGGWDFTGCAVALHGDGAGFVASLCLGWVVLVFLLVALGLDLVVACRIHRDPWEIEGDKGAP